MRKSRFTEEEIVAILAEQERGQATAEVCRKHGISQNTLYKWKAKRGGLRDARPQACRTRPKESVWSVGEAHHCNKAWRWSPFVSQTREIV